MECGLATKLVSTSTWVWNTGECVCVHARVCRQVWYVELCVGMCLILGFLYFNHWDLGLFPSAQKKLLQQLKGCIFRFLNIANHKAWSRCSDMEEKKRRVVWECWATEELSLLMGRSYLKHIAKFWIGRSNTDLVEDERLLGSTKILHFNWIDDISSRYLKKN